MSIFLVSYAYFVIFVEDHESIIVNADEKVNNLIRKDIEITNVENYYRQGLRNSMYKSLDELIKSKDIVWDENPYPDVLNEYSGLVNGNFELLLKDLDFENFDKLPRKFNLNFSYNMINVDFVEELVVSDKDSVFSLSRKIEFKEKIGFDFKIFDELYRKYKDFDDEEKCNDNLEEGVKCDLEGDFYNFEVETKDLSVMKPTIMFKMRKSKPLFSDSNS